MKCAPPKETPAASRELCQGRGRLLWLACWMILTVGTTGAQAQDSTRTDSSGAVASAPGPRALVNDAVTAYQSEAYARAETLLRRVARREAGYISPEHGAAAYWRGQAHRAQRDTGAALAAYQRGLSVQGRVGSGSVRLAGTFLQMVLDSGRLGNEARAEAAAYAYRVLLGSTAQPLPEAQRRQADRQVALLGLLLPERVKQEEVFQKPAMWDQAPRTWTYRDGAGAQMLQWWRSQDPAPVTQKNERIIEHLRRVAYARQSYRYGQSPTRLDDRGKTYVRYG